MKPVMGLEKGGYKTKDGPLGGPRANQRVRWTAAVSASPPHAGISMVPLCATSEHNYTWKIEMASGTSCTKASLWEISQLKSYRCSWHLATLSNLQPIRETLDFVPSRM